MTHITCRLTAKNWDQLQNPLLWQSSMGYLFYNNAQSEIIWHLLFLLCKSYKLQMSVASNGWLNASGFQHTHTFNGPLSGTTQVSRYQKGKTNLDFTGERESEGQWHQLGHTQICTSLQTDNHDSTSLLSLLQARCPSCHPTNSVKALKATSGFQRNSEKCSKGVGRFQGLSRTQTRFQDCPRSATTLSRRGTTQKFTLTMTIWWINLLTISSCSLTAIPPMHRPHRSNGNPSASSCLLNCWRISLVCRASSLYKQPNTHACTTEALLINKPESTGCRFCSLKFSYSMSALWSAIGYHQRLASLQLVRLIIAQISTTLQMQLWEW